MEIENELAAFIAGSDYRLGVHEYSGTLIVEVIYVPAFKAVDMGGRLPMVTNNGIIASRRIGRWRQWRRAERFVRETIEGHRKLLAAGVVQAR
jgi:hypothetical protein